MPDANLKVVVAGDISNLQNAMAKAGGVTQDFANKSTKAIDQTTEALKILGSSGSQSIALLTAKLEILKSAQFNEKDLGKLANYNQQIKVTAAEIDKLGNIGAGGLGKLTSGASQAFSSLRKLAYVLPGIGIAGIIGIATEPIIEGIKALGEALFGAANAEKAFDDTLENTAKEFSKATATVSELTTEVSLAKQGFLSKDEVLKKYNESIGKTTGVVKTLDEAEQALVNKGAAYIQLTLAKAAATYAYQKAAESTVQALLLSAKIENAPGFIKSSLEGKISDLNKEAQAYKTIGDNATTVGATISKINGFSFFGDDKVKKAKQGITTVQQALDALGKELDFLNAKQLGTGISQAKEKITAAENTIKELITKLGVKPNNSIILDLFKDIDVLQATLPLKHVAETAATYMGRIRREISALNADQINLGIDKSKEKIQVLESAIKELITKFKIDPKSNVILGIYAEILGLEPNKLVKFKHDSQKDLEAEKLFIPVEFKVDGAGISELNKDIENAEGTRDLKKFSLAVGIDFARSDAISQLKNLNVEFADRILENGIKIKIPIKIATPKELDTALNAATDKVQKFSDGINNILANTFSNGLTAIGEGIATALDSGDIAGAFNGIFKQLAEGIKQLGEYIIQFYGFKKILGSLNLSPAAGIAIGLGLVILGSLIQSKLSKKTPGFATGVGNFAGGSAIVGEHGPELLNLPGGSDIIPNGQLNNMTGGVFIANTIIRGSDIVISYNRQTATNGRNN